MSGRRLICNVLVSPERDGYNASTYHSWHLTGTKPVFLLIVILNLPVRAFAVRKEQFIGGEQSRGRLPIKLAF